MTIQDANNALSKLIKKEKLKIKSKSTGITVTGKKEDILNVWNRMMSSKLPEIDDLINQFHVMFDVSGTKDGVINIVSKN